MKYFVKFLILFLATTLFFISCGDDNSSSYSCYIQSTNLNPNITWTDIDIGNPGFYGTYTVDKSGGNLPDKTFINPSTTNFAQLNYDLPDASSLIEITVYRTDQYSAIKIYLYQDSTLLASQSLSSSTNYTGQDTAVAPCTLTYKITSTTTTPTTTPATSN